MNEMGIKPNDMTGKRFGRLTVLHRAQNRSGMTAWHCRCDCGTELDVIAHNLVIGNTRSCGCLKRDRVSDALFKHGLSKSHIYHVWNNMHQYCENPNNPSFKYYGLRLVVVCEGWSDFQPFFEWAKENGYAPGLVLTRIDPSGDFEPGNCKFATRKESCKTRRRK